MFESLSEAYRLFLIRWVDGARRFALAVALASVAFTGLAAWYFATNVAINTDTQDMLSQDLDFRRHSAAVSEAFPQFSDNILVVVDADTAGRADDAAMELARRMRERPDLFGDVYDLEGHPFFRRNGLLFMDEDELIALSDRLAEAQPFLGALWRDPSLRGLFRMLGLAARHMGGEGAGLDIAPVLGAVADVAEGKTAYLSWRKLMKGGGAAAQPPRRYILIQPAMDFSTMSPASRAMDGVRELALGLDEGIRVRLTGSAALDSEELDSVQDGMGLAGILSLVFVALILGVGVRSWRLVAAVLATLVMGLIWTGAFAALSVGELNLLSVAFAVLFIGLSVDFGIHFALRYKEAVNGGMQHADALSKAAEGVGGALTLCAVAAAIGFYSFLPTDYLGLAELGLIAGSGMFIALFANMTTLPALLTLMPLKPGARGDAWGFSAAPVLARNARPVLAAALAVGVGAAFVAPRAGFDFDPLNLKDPNTESVSTLFEVMADSRTGPYSITVLADSLDAARAMGERLSGLETVKEVRTLTSYVPKGQDEKLETIGDMAMFLLPALSAKPEAPPAPGEIREALEAAGAALSALDDPEARRLAAAVKVLPMDDSALKALEGRLLGGLPGRLKELRQSLDAGPVGIDDLPEQLRDREVAGDGRAKLKVYPKADLRDRAELRRFVEEVRGVIPTATGSPVVILEAGNTVVDAFIEAGIISIVLISLLMGVLLRRLRDGLMVFAPLVLAALLTASASVFIGQPFNFANVIVLPLLFGLGVASGIHLVLRAHDGDGAVFETSTPRAVVLSALTTIASFGSIALSSHPGTSSMGVLLTIAIALTMACTLTVLPALMAVWPPEAQERREA